MNRRNFILKTLGLGAIFPFLSKGEAKTLGFYGETEIGRTFYKGKEIKGIIAEETYEFYKIDGVHTAKLIFFDTGLCILLIDDFFRLSSFELKEDGRPEDKTAWVEQCIEETIL